MGFCLRVSEQFVSLGTRLERDGCGECAKGEKDFFHGHCSFDVVKIREGGENSVGVALLVGKATDIYEFSVANIEDFCENQKDIVLQCGCGVGARNRLSHTPNAKAHASHRHALRTVKHEVATLRDPS